MIFVIQTTTDPKIAAEFLARKILEKLDMGQKVLWLVPGGSAMDVVVETARIISKNPHRNLTITLTDERYGKVGHKDSNWQQLLDKNFNLTEANLIPVLIGKNLSVTTERFDNIIMDELQNADYKIGLFGMGADGHTAGILPEASSSQFSRITITPRHIESLDEAVVWAQGRKKWGAIEKMSMYTKIEDMPAQALKKVPKLTIFTDYKK